MTLNIETHERVPFYVESVVVTPENRPEVAEWCGGELQVEAPGGEHNAGTMMIRVPVKNPTNDRRTKAYDGDRVVKLKREFKVYDAKAFERAFQTVSDALPNEAVVFDGSGVVINVYTSNPSEIETVAQSVLSEVKISPSDIAKRYTSKGGL